MTLYQYFLQRLFAKNSCQDYLLRLTVKTPFKDPCQDILSRHPVKTSCQDSLPRLPSKSPAMSPCQETLPRYPPKTSFPDSLPRIPAKTPYQDSMLKSSPKRNAGVCKSCLPGNVTAAHVSSSPLSLADEIKKTIALTKLSAQ